MNNFEHSSLLRVMMYRFLLMISLFLVNGNVQAQVLQHLDSLHSKRYFSSSTDTSYIERPKERWFFRTRLNISGESLSSVGEYNGYTLDTDLRADNKTTVSWGVTYRGISLNLAVNPAHMKKKNCDFEFNMNAYGNRMGADIIYHQTKTMKGLITETPISGTGDIIRVDWPAGTLDYTSLYINTYYAFSGKRFSMPAAFTQSYIQKQSAGSWLASINFSRVKAQITDEWPDYRAGTSITFNNVSIGGGYGYNLVLPHQWFIHLSSTPTFTVYNDNVLHQPGEHGDMHFKIPQVNIPARGAIVKSFGKFVTGASMVYNYAILGYVDDIQLHTSKWRMRAFVGFRL